MSAQVIPLVTKADVDAAWAAYAALAERAIAEPSLLTNRSFMEDYTAKEAKFKRLFLASSR